MMTIYQNYWVQKRYKAIDEVWMLFVWGFPEISMLNALERAARKSHKGMHITEVSPVRWEVVDPETDTRYIVERRDDQPVQPDGANFSYRDQTMPVNPERKKMPTAKSLFSQQELF